MRYNSVILYLKDCNCFLLSGNQSYVFPEQFCIVFTGFYAKNIVDWLQVGYGALFYSWRYNTHQLAQL